MLSLHEDLKQWFELLAIDVPVRLEPVSGGCINEAYRVVTNRGEHLFLKHHSAPPAGFFEAEASGLNQLRDIGAFRVPEVIGYRQHDLLLEYIPPDNRGTKDWSHAGRCLALQHQRQHRQFGFDVDTYCGLSCQPNRQSSDGYSFFACQRLHYQSQLPTARRCLSKRDRKLLERICQRLPELIPRQPPSLLHGELWSGKLYFSQGIPVVIDPACYWGWAEADLGMTRLFGGFPDSFYAAYQEVRPLDPGWGARLDLYNLYHLLNHLNLFGEGYLGQVRELLARFGR